MSENKYIWLYHRDKNAKTINQFIDLEHVYNITSEELFKDNIDIIFKQMNMTDKSNYIKAIGKPKGYTLTSADLKSTMTLPCPCNLRIDPSKVTAEMAIRNTNFQLDTENFYAFAHDKIQAIFQNEGFRADGLNKLHLDCQVFGWFKSLYFIGKEGNNIIKNNDAGFMNISSYIISMSTMSGKEGGSFTLRLPIIDTENYFRFIGKNSVTQNSKKSKNFYQADGDYYAKIDFSRVESNLFSWLISSNDLLFLSFEKLAMEPARDLSNQDSDAWGINTKISGKVYDMIALVDDVKVVTDAASASAFVEITGRDLMKLLIEDGSFFYNPSVASNPSSVFANATEEMSHGDIRDVLIVNGEPTNPFNRLRRSSEEIDVFSNQMNMDIAFILKGVISQLANIEVVPGYVFNSWGDDRTKFVDLFPKTKNK